MEPTRVKYAFSISHLKNSVISHLEKFIRSHKTVTSGTPEFKCGRPHNVYIQFSNHTKPDRPFCLFLRQGFVYNRSRLPKHWDSMSMCLHMWIQYPWFSLYTYPYSLETTEIINWVRELKLNDESPLDTTSTIPNDAQKIEWGHTQHIHLLNSALGLILMLYVNN